MTKQFKINPDYTCPELAGYKLPPCSRCQEDEINYAEILHLKSRQTGNSFELGFKAGYHKAREKYEFSREQLLMAIKIARTPKKITFDGDELTGKIIHKHLSPSEVISEVIALTTRHPIAIEVEMWPSIPGKDDKEIPKLNPDGTVKGIYIYE